jgi:hypothetical protein
MGDQVIEKKSYLWIAILHTAAESVLVKRQCFMTYGLVSTPMMFPAHNKHTICEK